MSYRGRIHTATRCAGVSLIQIPNISKEGPTQGMLVGHAVSGNGPGGQSSFTDVNTRIGPSDGNIPLIANIAAMPGRTRALILLLALVAFSGCGGLDDEGSTSTPAPAVQGDQRGVLETIDDLQTASRSGDGLRICNDIFTPSLVRSIEASAKRKCPTEVRKRLFRPDASISVQRGIDVTGRTASAIILEQDGEMSKLHFVKQAGSWRINRVTPQEGS